MTAFVNLRNTVSRQTAEYTKEEADRILAHPVWGKVNEVVRTAKPEVLATVEHTDPQRSDETVEVKNTNEKKEAK